MFSVQLYAAPSVLPLKVQLLSVLSPAPKPELPISAQLFRIPPMAAALNAAPLVKVNPDRLALLVRYTHKFDWPPLMMVNSGPLTLRTASGLAITTRVAPPSCTRLPVA